MLLYETKPLATDDSLWFLRIMCFDIPQNKLVKYLMIIILVVYTILIAFQAFLYLQRFDGYYFIKYLPIYASSYYLLLCICSASPFVKTSLASLTELKMWKINCADPRIENRIKMESLYLNGLTLFIAISMYVTVVTHFLPLEGDEDIFYPLPMFKEYFPEWENLLCWLFRVTFFPLPLVLPLPCYIVIYSTSQLRFQFYMLLYFLENINTGYKTTDPDSLIDDRHYQKEIKKRLLFCVKRHLILLTVAQKMNKKLKTYIFLFSLMGVILGISGMVFLFSFQGSWEDRYTRLVTLIISFLLIVVHVAMAGQLVENVSAQPFEILRRASWHCWNSDNKNIYLLFLINTQHILKIKFSDSFSLNYKLVVSILKGVYSIASVMVHLKHIDFSKY